MLSVEQIVALAQSPLPLSAESGIFAEMHIHSVARNMGGGARDVHSRVLPERGEERLPPRKSSLYRFCWATRHIVAGCSPERSHGHRARNSGCNNSGS